MAMNLINYKTYNWLPVFSIESQVGAHIKMLQSVALIATHKQQIATIYATIDPIDATCIIAREIDARKLDDRMRCFGHAAFDFWKTAGSLPDGMGSGVQICWAARRMQLH
jgi:hypothetical protein